MKYNEKLKLFIRNNMQQRDDDFIEIIIIRLIKTYIDFITCWINFSLK